MAHSAALQAIEGRLAGGADGAHRILAEQHYLKLAHWLRPLGVKIAWLSGGLEARAKSRPSRRSPGETLAAIGTRALQEGVEFAARPRDRRREQHRFGVAQRLALTGKERGGERPRTPADDRRHADPRTLSMSYYADLDVTVIDELPRGARP